MITTSRSRLMLSSVALIFLSAIAFYYSYDPAPRKPVFQSLPEHKEPKAVPNDWLAKQKLYPNAAFSHDHYLFALRQAKLLHENSPSHRSSWELAGPKNIGGRITDIAIHPDNPSTMYIGAASGGIFKTTNGGFSWENVFHDAPVISIGALAIDPANQNVIYAGTGEANASSYSFIGNGVYKSNDAGQTWDHIGLEYSAYIGRILVDHSNSQRVFVAACGTLFTPNDQRGIYRSLDGGESWERVLFVSDTTAGVDIVQHPSNPDILYASMWERRRGITYRRSHGITSGIYKTTNGGDTWTLLENGLPGGSQKGRIGLAIAQNNPDIVYAFIDWLVGSSYIASVYKTTDGGQQWQQTNDGVLSGINSTFGWYFGQIRVDPSNDNRIWVLGVDMYRSDNGGNSYTQIAGYYNIDEIYVDQHAMWINPSTGFIVHGNDGGLYTSSDYGNTWNKINNLPLTQFYTIEVDYLNPARIYGGTQDNNTVRTPTGSLTDWQRILGGDGFYVLVDYTNSNIIYAESQWGNLYRSLNGGSNFSYIAGAFSGDRTNWSSPYVMHPTDPQTLYFGTYRVWKTTNRGNTWTAISGDLTYNLVNSGFSTISTLAISSLNPNYLLAGSDDGRVHITTNGGMNWADISSGLPVRWITRVAFDPFDANTIYATVSGFRWDEPHPYVFRSSNLGQDWQSISGNLPDLPVNVIIADPGVQQRIFVGTDAGIFYTENGGEAWWGLSQGIPNVPVTDLKIHQPTRTIIAGTYGCSAYKLNLDMLTGLDKIAAHVRTNPIALTAPKPNPYSISSQSGLEIVFYLATESDINLEIYSLGGVLIANLKSGILRGGSHSIKWDVVPDYGKPIIPGVYIISLRTPSGSVNQKLVVVS